VRYPASWRTEQAERDGVTYRYFLAPLAGPERKPAASVTLIASGLEIPLDTYAQSYLAGKNVASSRDEQRPTARGKSWRLTSADGKTRERLLLLQEESRVYGLFGQGDASLFAAQERAIEAMEKSLTLERYAQYLDERNDEYGFSLKVPPAWKLGRNFSGGGTFSKQYTSPAFGMDKRQTVHASLTITAEPLPAGGTLERFHKASQDKLGEAYKLFNHSSWKDGHVDTLVSETQFAMYRSKRFYRVANGRGYTLAFEARDDIYHRAQRWFDMIANSFKVGAELGTP
jgi:hypothetical protein